MIDENIVLIRKSYLMEAKANIPRGQTHGKD